MATETEMGEIEDMHSKEEGDPILNGNISDVENGDIDSDSDKKTQNSVNNEPMEVDDEENDTSSENAKHVNHDTDEISLVDNDKNDDGLEIREVDCDEEEEEEDEEEEEEEDDDNNDHEEEGTVRENHENVSINESVNIDDDDEDEDDDVTEIIDDDDDEYDLEMSAGLKNGLRGKIDEPIELNDDSGDGEGDGDVMIIDEPKENGRISDELEVIELDAGSPAKDQSDSRTVPTPTRRSVRNINKQPKSYDDDVHDTEKASSLPLQKEDQSRHVDPTSSEEESDIEEVLPQDPLAMLGDKGEHRRAARSKPQQRTSSTIVVKDTKRLVEIAAKSNSNPGGNKKEPTLVIIDTNSILSGRGPVPANKPSQQLSSLNQQYSAFLPMALPAQGMYPPNMRATITPIPLNTPTPSPQSAKTSTPLSLSTQSTTSSSSPSSYINPAAIAPVLPTLTDDMFVVEAPSFIVPYVYEKPPVNDFKKFLKEVADEITKAREEEEKDNKESSEENKDKENVDKDDKSDDGGSKDDVIITEDFSKKGSSYFDSPLGKFFIDIGFNLVQEYVQSDLLKQQQKKRSREGGQNPVTNKTIHSLMKNLEFTKEHNEPFKQTLKRCEFCSFKTESKLVMANHLETPHTKNYVYKCNFCAYEARSPHDILFHMEAEHAVRGHLDRAPSFHQCPNCPFEDNQKGKLSRHLVTCTRKFKPERNLDPPIDWEPPAKIPRVPKARQGINVSAYQAMKSSQLQLLSKMQLLNPASPGSQALHRGRGRPTLGGNQMKHAVMRAQGMVYKQTMSGGSVLVPTNYQLSGNQVYQVVGGQELGGRLGHPGHMAFVPNIPSASSTFTIQNQPSKNKNAHQPSISITPLPRASTATTAHITSKPGDTNSKNSFVICEICDGYIKDLEQLRNHMQWIHKVKIHPKMIYNRPPLNCQKCQFRFFTDQGLERHLLGSHGLVTSSMQDAANKSKDAGRCPVCGRVYQWKLLNHVARDHNMTLKPAHLSYKCTVCTATFGMYKQFENHVYSAHSVVAKRVMDKKNSSSAPSSSSNKNDQILKPLKINDEITIIPQPPKPAAKEGSPTESSRTTPSTSKNDEEATENSSLAEKAAPSEAQAPA